MTNSLKSDFLRAISTAGIKPPQNVVIDGQIHRFSTNDKIGDNAGWYVLKNHGDFTFGAFGDWRTGIQEKWTSIDEFQMSEVEKDEMWKESDSYLRFRINRRLYFFQAFFYAFNYKS